MKELFFLCGAEGIGDTFWQPYADIYRVARGWVVKFDLAGVRSEDIHISAEGECLTIYGVRRDLVLQETCDYHSLEISYSRFKRSIPLPSNLRGAQITTDYKDGMLLVRITLKADQNE